MYKLIVYKVINFKIPRGNKMINKRYFQKVYSTTGVEKENITKEYLKLKTKYNEWYYMISDIKADDIDWYIEKLNKKSEKAYKDYILGGGINEL